MPSITNDLDTRALDAERTNRGCVCARQVGRLPVIDKEVQKLDAGSLWPFTNGTRVVGSTTRSA